MEGFGRGRVRVGHVHPDAIKIAHWFPTLFLLSMFILPVITVFKTALGLTGISLLLIYFIAIFSSAWSTTGSLYVGLLSIPSAWVQLTGYGFGFLSEKFKKPASR